MWFLQLCCTDAAVMKDSSEAKLERVKALVKITHEQLIKEGCPIPDFSYKKRDLMVPSRNEVLIEMQTILKERLIDALIECRTKKVSASSVYQTSLTTMTSTTSMMPTAQQTVTKASSLPVECQKAINLTESYRLDYISTSPSKGDTKRMIAEGRPWFRFTKGAGNMLIDHCVTWNTCGTSVPLFSNSSMPAEVGVVQSIEIYGPNKQQNCGYFQDKGSVMRCSAKLHDYIYRYDGSNRSSDIGFCGMAV